MSTNFAALAWKAAGTGTVSRTFGNRAANCINVKEFGAVGDGLHNDQPNVQAAIDYVETGVVAGDTKYARASLYFPPGDYRISSSATGAAGLGALVVNLGQSNHFVNFKMLGDNSATTRIFYDVTNDFIANENTILLSLDNRVDQARFEGLHFDMLPAFGSKVLPDNSRGNTLCVWNRGRQTNAGNANTWWDCKFTGGVFGIGLSGEGAALGSENQFKFCKYSDCHRGWVAFSSNALGYNMRGGYAKNCNGGIVAQQGGCPFVTGMEFEGNSPGNVDDSFVGDFASQNANPASVIGCVSTSQDFITYANAALYLACNYHHASSVGQFWRDLGPAVLDANWSTNGKLTNPSHGDKLYIRANRFDNASYLSGWSAPQLGENI